MFKVLPRSIAFVLPALSRMLSFFIAFSLSKAKSASDVQ